MNPAPDGIIINPTQITWELGQLYISWTQKRDLKKVTLQVSFKRIFFDIRMQGNKLRAANFFVEHPFDV